MVRNRLTPGLVTGILLVLFIGAALYIRVYLPYHDVFSDGIVKFTGPDAYYHMRLVDNLVQHFPFRISFDPYTYFPHGTLELWPPFFDWLIAGIAWLVGLGSPSQQVVDTVGAWVPAILGILIIIPVYFIGKELFHRWTGVLAAGLIAVLPGRFLGDSIIGAADHHIAETLLTTIVMLFLILAIKSARKAGLNLSHLRHWDWNILKAPLVYSLLAGVALGVYLLTWVGGVMFVLVVFIFFVVQIVIDHLNNRPLDYLVIIGPLLFAATAVTCGPIIVPLGTTGQLSLVSLLIALVTPVALTIMSRWLCQRRVKAVYYPFFVAGTGILIALVIYLASPSFFLSAAQKFEIFTPGNASQTIMEVKPLLFVNGQFSLAHPWNQFNTNFFLGLISLGAILYLAIKRGEAGKVLLIIWSLFILALTLAQIRFVYYFAVNVALLAGYAAWQILRYFKFDTLAEEKGRPLEKAAKKKARAGKSRPGNSRPATRWAFMSTGVLLVFFLCYFPSIKIEEATIESSIFTPGDTLYKSLTWLRDNSPEPFGDPDYYYQNYTEPPTGKDYAYPPSAYGVISLWDYGHWITSIARRIPVSNPFQQGASVEARFLLSQDETSANNIANRLGIRYVLTDQDMIKSKFYTLPSWIGKELANYQESFYQEIDGNLVPMTLYYPSYFRSLAVRLYTFEGKAVDSEGALVITYEVKVSQEGAQYNQVINMRSFPTYEAAAHYVSVQKPGNYRIGSGSPQVSPVAVDALQHYQLVYSSPAASAAGKTAPPIKIFEYVK
jgi:oligosaccharyl transferase (archaeosortase A-associated)